MSKSSLLKNVRNYAEYLRKKERGPVKAYLILLGFVHLNVLVHRLLAMHHS